MTIHIIKLSEIKIYLLKLYENIENACATAA
jgi:hypothetical protein